MPTRDNKVIKSGILLFPSFTEDFSIHFSVWIGIWDGYLLIAAKLRIYRLQLYEIHNLLVKSVQHHHYIQFDFPVCGGINSLLLH